MQVPELLQELGWRTVHSETRPSREARYAPVPEWLPSPVRNAARQQYPRGLFTHQAQALEAWRQGEHVALTTTTASGKSLVFFLAALALLTRDTNARVAVLYPLKALAREQARRWQGWLSQVGLPTGWVQRIDGDIRTEQREDILREARIVLFTPDVVHAWLLLHVTKPAVMDFLRRLALVVVDEVHTYTGVFGSNAAYLFRRWRHLMRLIRDEERQWIAASATVREPENHLEQLFGLPFTLIDAAQDGSPQHPLHIHLVEPPSGQDLLAALGNLFQGLAIRTQHRFLAFTNSRKQAEILAAIVQRTTNRSPDEVDDALAMREIDRVSAVLAHAPILPYRAGYESVDRFLIQQRLSEGSLKGVISTSALEAGLDIGHLDVAVLVGVPPTMTAFLQRIGRIGRQGHGHVLVVNTGDPQDQALFRNPGEALRRPPAESALYLQNRYLQYIHVLCLARTQVGEHDRLLAALGHATNGEAFRSPIAWPAGFMERCHEERTGQVPRELRNWAAGSQNEHPQWIYPLRDVEPQFEVFQAERGAFDQRPLGRLSFYQVLNEAYPGAVYYYASVPYRVYRVSPRSRKIKVKRLKKRYTTKPRKYTRLQPSLRVESVHKAYQWGPLVALDTEWTIWEIVQGFEEQRGSRRIVVPYPNDYWDREHFQRGYESTGVLLTHPELGEGLRPLAQQLYEAFLLTLPVEPQEIGWAAGRMPVGHEPFFRKGQGFVALYDRVYGGLHLAGRLLDEGPDLLRHLLETARSLQSYFDHPYPALLDEWLRLLHHAPQALTLDPWGITAPTDGARHRVLLPGTRGYVQQAHNHWDVLIKDLFYHPRQGLMYKGVLCEIELHSPASANTEQRFRLDEVHPIPGVSCLGWYDEETGETIPDEEADCLSDDDCWQADRRIFGQREA